MNFSRAASPAGNRPGLVWATGVGLAALATGVVYLAGAGAIAGEWGYPIDDGWIHQVFARNLAETGQMAFNRGEPAAGSTAPLWTVLLALVRLAPVDPVTLSYLLGLLCLAGSGWLTVLLWQELNGGKRGWPAAMAAGIVMLDWHLAWSALSGMETPLFVLLSLTIVYAALRRRPAWQVGLLGGLLAATRPEGIALAGLCWAYLAASGVTTGSDQQHSQPLAGGVPRRLVTLAGMTGGFALGAAAPLAPLVLFSLAVSGSPLPNTYFAKTAYYGAGGLSRLWSFLAQALTILGHGPLGFVALGIPFALLETWRRRGPALLLFAWPVALLGLYAWRLPVAYHHARYEMPALPFLLLLGWWGLGRVPGLAALKLAPRVAVLLLVGLLAVTWGEGAIVYGRDVRLINTVQVGAARWLRENTPQDALVATHDIGAIGYLSGRQAVDTAGLVTPEAVPLIGNQDAMLAFLRERRVGYVAQFTVWYPRISAALADREVYRIHDQAVIAAGGDDFVIYRTGW